MPDNDDRVFDVSKPPRGTPSPTSRPIIVGHQPAMNDPMVRDANDLPAMPSEPKPIPVQAHEDNVPQPAVPPLAAEHPESVMAAAEPPASTEYVPTGDMGLTPMSELLGNQDKPAEKFEMPPHSSFNPSEPVVQPLVNSGHHHRSGKKGLWAIIVIILILIAAYLAIDSRLIKTSINLPFHIFKQPAAVQPTVTAPTTQKSSASTTPTVPAGFTAYQFTPAGLSFDYPTDWGAPTVTNDPGFSSRSATAKSDGTYAYLVNFATNKDVQMAVTSSKYLPPNRTPLYYDYLQWCVGSNDGKIYKSILHYTTANKVDTPSTTTCDQGPLSDAAKTNDFTIVQLKTKNADGSLLGDLYTVNLKEADLPVLRVKDATSANAENIKKLLATVEALPASSSSTSTNSSSQ